MAAPAATRSTVSGSDLASYAQALLRALARDEAMGRRAPRLTEAGQATWQRFRGRLGSAELVQLLAEDGAVVHPLPFDPARVRAPFDLAQLDDDVVDEFLRALPTLALTQPAAAACTSARAWCWECCSTCFSLATRPAHRSASEWRSSRCFRWRSGLSTFTAFCPGCSRSCFTAVGSSI